MREVPATLWYDAIPGYCPLQAGEVAHTIAPKRVEKTMWKLYANCCRMSATVQTKNSAIAVVGVNLIS